MTKTMWVLLIIAIVLQAAAVLLFYNGLRVLSDHGLRGVIEEVWEGKK